MTKFQSVRSFIDLIDLSKYNNVFNPSIQINEGVIFISFRAATRRNQTQFGSYLIKYDPVTNNKEEIDISLIGRSFGIAICSDPKLVTLNDEVWLTFNTGYSTAFNAIYLMNVSGIIGKPFECILEKRDNVEKNWAFFKEDNLLKAIYSINPLRKIYLVDVDESKLVFKFRFIQEQDSFCKLKTNTNLSIGTQLARTGDFSYLIAHEKIRIANKRLYFGRFVSIINNDIKIHDARAFHSYLSLLGNKKKFNKNLISCTYFSGLLISDSDFFISYGINDTNFDIKRIDIKSIWY